MNTSAGDTEVLVLAPTAKDFELLQSIFKRHGIEGRVCATLEEMWQPVKPMSEGYQAATDEWMGMSFFINGTGAQRVLGHTGHQGNFGAFFFFNPRTRLAVIASYNTTNYDDAVLKAGLESKVQHAAVDLLR